MTETRSPYLYVKEAEFKTAVVEAARRNGWKVYSIPDSRLVYPQATAGGYPDLTMAKGDHLVFAELKARGKKLTPAQEKWLEALKVITRVDAFRWEPSDWDGIISLLDGG